MKIRAIKCNDCGDTIYSRANHDYMTCACGKIAIDGGQDGYWRVCGESEHIERIVFEMDVTLKELYDDWNTMTDKYVRKR